MRVDPNVIDEDRFCFLAQQTVSGKLSWRYAAAVFCGVYSKYVIMSGGGDK